MDREPAGRERLGGDQSAEEDAVTQASKRLNGGGEALEGVSAEDASIISSGCSRTLTEEEFIREYGARVSQERHFRAVLCRSTDIKHAITDTEGVRAAIPRIPSVIRISKDYGTFKISLNEQTNTELALKSDLTQQMNESPSETPPVSQKPSSSNRKSPINSPEVVILLKPDNAFFTPSFPVIEVTLTFHPSYFSYNELLEQLMPAELIPASFETIGDIIHLNLSEEQLPYRTVIADALHFKTGMTVINKIGKIDNTFRFYQSEVLAVKPGKEDHPLETVHRESGISYFLDLGRVYWCSRLQSERERLLQALSPGQTLCDPFCGAGPHVLPALARGLHVIAGDLNPSAISCLRHSLELNKLKVAEWTGCSADGSEDGTRPDKRVRVDVPFLYLTCTDAGSLLTKFKGTKIDHFVFNLPEHSLEYIKYLAGYSNFTLHCFFFASLDPQETVKAVSGLAVPESALRLVRMASPTKGVYKLELTDKEITQYSER